MSNKIILVLISFFAFVIIWSAARIYVNYNHDIQDAYKMAIGGVAALIWAYINENIVK